MKSETGLTRGVSIYCFDTNTDETSPTTPRDGLRGEPLGGLMTIVTDDYRGPTQGDVLNGSRLSLMEWVPIPRKDFCRM